jgi:hypothetical protein
MVGGSIIEISEPRPYICPKTGEGTHMVRIWVVDSHPYQFDELCVNAEVAKVMPKVGDKIWWTSGLPDQDWLFL